MNAAAPERNLHHTRTQYDYTDEELWREQQRDMAEAEYFAHVEPTNTQDYPPTLQTAIVLGNESDGQELPF